MTIASKHGGHGDGGGGSRASKKRAKKKQKELLMMKTQQNDKGIVDSAAADSGHDDDNHNGRNENFTNSVDMKGNKTSKKGLKRNNHKLSKAETDGTSSCTSKHQLPLDDDDNDGDDTTINDTIQEQTQRKRKKKKRKKEKKQSSDSDNIVQQSEEEIKEKYDTVQEDTNTKEEKVGEDRDHVDANDDDDDDSEILDQFLSNLTPAEILFPETFESKDNEMDRDGDSDEEGLAEKQHQPNPLEIIANVTTEKRANVLFNAIIAPSGLSSKSFYEHYWEKKPLLISQNKNIAELDNSGTVYGQDLDFDDDDDNNNNNEVTSSRETYQHRFDGFLSKKDIETLVSDFPMKYGKDLNVTNYCDMGGSGKRRVTLDQLPDLSGGENEEKVEFIDAESNDVWSNFNDGCTVRLLCPQKHNDRVHSLLSNLEHEFGCMVGSNAYLTPGGALNQGFAPHYDDIEAFILQLEGYKHWRVYPPMSKGESLPRESSRDFTDEEMKDIDPVIDVILGPGDLLYMPRGWIHQANTCKSNHHSLHLTVSAMQNWSWVDFLETIIPEALDAASASSTSLRAGLPRNFLSYMGTMHDVTDTGSDILKNLEANKKDGEESETKEDRRQKRMRDQQEAFKAEAKKKIARVCKEAVSMITSGCDQIAKRFLSDRLPPALTPNEAAFTSDNRAESGGKIFPNTLVRLAKPGLARLVIEDDKAVIYHSLDNSRVYHEQPLSPLEFEIDDAPALEMLLTTTEPHWICVQDLIHGDIEDKMEISQALYDEGILAMFQSDIPDRSIQTG